MLARPATSTIVTRHLAIVLLSVWAVYVYRDVWPFATTTLSPLDTSEGPLLWAKLADLTFAAVVVPLLIPRPYVPFDPKVIASALFFLTRWAKFAPSRTRGLSRILSRLHRSCQECCSHGLTRPCSRHIGWHTYRMKNSPHLPITTAHATS